MDYRPHHGCIGNLYEPCPHSRSDHIITCLLYQHALVLIDFSLTVKAATLIFISGRVSSISSAKQGRSGSIVNLVKN